MSSSNIADLWKDAISKYEGMIQDLDETKSSNFFKRGSKKTKTKTKIAPTIQTLDELDKAIESAHSEFTQFSEKNATLRKYVTCALLPIEKLGGLVSAAVAPVGGREPLLFMTC
jgi:hypothetical protein